MYVKQNPQKLYIFLGDLSKNWGILGWVRLCRIHALFYQIGDCNFIA